MIVNKHIIYIHSQNLNQNKFTLKVLTVINQAIQHYSYNENNIIFNVPLHNKTIFTMIDFTWNFVNPVIKKLFKTKKIDIDDLKMSSQFDSEQIAEQAKQIFYTQGEKQISYFRTYARITKKHFVAVFLLAPFSALCFVAQPICIEMFQQYLNLDAFFIINEDINGRPTITQLSIREIFTYLFKNLGPFILLNFIAQFMYSVFNSLLCYNTIQLAVKFSALTLEMLFQKLQRLSEATKNANAQGSLMNLLYCDIFKVQQFLQMSYWGPVIIANLIYCSIVLGVEVDPRALILFVALLIMVLFSITFAVQMQKQLNRVAPVRDQRSQQVQEMLQGMKVIKLFNLHDWQLNKIMNTRKHELQIVLKSNIYNSCSILMTWGAYGIITVIVVGFLIQQNKFDVMKVFTTIALVTLCADAIGFLPQLVTFMQDSLVSFKRIQAFLTLPETDQYLALSSENNENPFNKEENKVVIQITGGQNFSHSNEQDLLVRPELDQQFYEKLDKKKILTKDHTNVKHKIQHLASNLNQSDEITHQIIDNIQQNNYLLEQELNDQICRQLELPSATYYSDVLNYHTELFKHEAKDDASRTLMKAYLQLCILEFHINGKPIEKQPAVIKNLQLTVNQGELIGITGNIASGKSSLFLAILGELRRVIDKDKDINQTESQLIQQQEQCQRIINGSIAFAPQSSPIFSMTIRENICFYKPFDEQKYRRIIEVSCLELDFTQFADGDQTVVGSKGVTLSGGQRARISLARALYSDADIYLLDDPLSALDPHVGKQIWTNAIIGYLMARGKTVLIASHQTHYFKQCSRIIHLENGRVQSDELNHEQASHIDSYTDAGNDRGTENTSVQMDFNAQNQQKNENKEDNNQDTDEEAKAITCKLYCKYFGSGNKCLFILFAIFLVIYGAAYQYQNVIISQWSSDQYGFLDTDQSEFNAFFEIIKQQTSVPDQFIRQVALNYFNAKLSQGNNNPYSINYYYIFVGCTAGLLLAILIMQIFYYLFAASSSKHLYGTTINKLLNTMLRFFDVVPGGKIINVLIKDCETIDIILARYFVSSSISFMYIFGMIITICIISYPSIAIIVPCVIIYMLIFRKFRIIVPNLRRLEAQTRTHVFNLCQEQMEYLITIRAYKKEQDVLNKFRTCLQDSIKSQYYTYSMVQWIQIRFGIIGAVLNALICMISCIISPFSLDVAQFSGVIIINCVNLQFGILIFVDNSTQFDAVMPTIERAMLYHGLEDEETVNQHNIKLNIQTDEYKQHEQELQQTGLCIKHLQMRYRPELKLTLQNMTVHFEKGDHVSIIGRTGQGKSSFVVSLLKLYQPESNGYHISLNGKALDSISVHELRETLAIIPQEPILFSGTVRQQLCEYSRNKASGLPYAHLQRISDERIWEMLQMVKLDDFIRKQPGGLDCQVISGGENFSSGQRQLICILRALLKDTEVVLLDEATSYVDKETDKIIQDIVKVHLKDKIVLSIAHRMETVLSMDKVLVIQSGCVAEYGEKHELYQQNGIFTSMCQKAGLVVE